MNSDPSLFLCFVGLLLWPAVTVWIVFTIYGHPFLGVVAGLAVAAKGSNSSK